MRDRSPSWQTVVLAILVVGCTSPPPPREHRLREYFAGSPPSDLLNSTEGAIRWIGVLGDPRLKHESSVNAVAVSPDGRLIASAGIGRTIRLWSSTTGAAYRTLIGHTSSISCLAFAPSGKHLVSGGDDKTLRVWDIEKSTPLRTLLGHTAGVLVVAVIPHSTWIVSGSKDGTVRIWDVDNGKEVRTLRWQHAPVSPVYAVAASPDGKWIVAGTWTSAWDGTIRIWEAASGRLVRAMRPERDANTCALLVTGEAVVSGDTRGVVTVWDVNTGRQARAVVPHEGPCWALAWARDEAWIVSGGQGGIIHVLDNRGRKRVRAALVHSGPVRSLAYSPSGDWLVSGSDDTTVRVWDLDTWTELLLHTPNPRINGLAIAPSGKWIARASGSKLALLNPIDGTVIQEIRGFGHFGPLAVGGGGAKLVFGQAGARVYSGEPSTVGVWDVRSGTRAGRFTGGHGQVLCLAGTADGKALVGGTAGNAVIVWNAVTGQKVHALAGHRSPVFSVAVSRSRNLIVSGSEGKTVRLWDLRSGARLGTLTGHREAVLAVAASPADKLVVSGDRSGEIRLWRGPDSDVVVAHKGLVTGVRFDDSGGRFFSIGTDRRLVVWDAGRGVPTDRIRLDATPAHLVVRGKRIWVACRNGTINVYEVGPPKGGAIAGGR